ncbi:MAG: hypothetical protein J5602_10775 [Clostridia bacterium]|nr:hypothetical protein [Clostridia bacterium]
MRRVLTAVCAALCVLLAGFSACADGEALLLTRDFSSRYAARGGWVTLSYTLRNTSSRAIGRVELTDPLLGDGQPEPIEDLAPGESRTVVARARVVEDAESAPVARYTTGGAEKTAAAAPEKVLIETVSLSARLTFETDEEKAVVLRVTNNGNAPVYGVKASDAALGDMGEAVDRLDPGESAAWTRAVPAPGGRYRCAVSAASSSGRNVTARSNALTARESSAASIEPEPVTLMAGMDGDGQLFVTLFNPGPDMLKDVTLREQNGGGERVIAFLPAGRSAHVPWPRVSEEARLMRFEAVSSEGAPLAEASIAAPAAPADASAEPDADLMDALDGPSLRMNEPPQTYRAMLFAVMAVMFAVMIVWHISHRRRRRQARKARLRRRQKKQQTRKSGEKTA